MSIVLIAVGKVDKEIFEVLKDNLRSFFKRRVAMGKTMPEPYYALNKGREQYLATAILNAIMDATDNLNSLSMFLLTIFKCTQGNSYGSYTQSIEEDTLKQSFATGLCFSNINYKNQ
jgi:predicted Zn-dependent protease